MPLLSHAVIWLLHFYFSAVILGFGHWQANTNWYCLLFVSYLSFKSYFPITWWSFSDIYISALTYDKHGQYHLLCSIIFFNNLLFSNHIISCSFYASSYGSIIVGAILSKLAAKGDPVKTGSDLSGKRRNRRASFSFHGGMQVFLPVAFQTIPWWRYVICFSTVKSRFY